MARLLSFAGGSAMVWPAQLAVACAGGLAMAMAHPPMDMGAVAFVALIPLLWITRVRSSWRALLLGLVYGLSFYGAVLWWMRAAGMLPWLWAVLIEGSFVALFGGLAPAAWRRTSGVPSALVVACLWTAIDWLRSFAPFGGATWGALGATQHDNPALISLAQVTGGWGITFVVVLVNALVVVALAAVAARRWRSAAALAGMIAAVLTLPALIPAPSARGAHLDVAAVQGNLEQAPGSRGRAVEVARNHIRLTRSLGGESMDVVVWPENAVDVDPDTHPALAQQTAAAVDRAGAPALVGAVTHASGNHYRNEVLKYSQDGRLVGAYAKRHLVPFGEYVPGRPLLGWVDRIRSIDRETIPGDEVRLFTVHGVRVGTPLCFESTFPRLVRDFVASGAEVLVIPANYSSFAESPASRQQLAMTQLRAAETGRWIVQATLSGESAVVDARGRVVAQTDVLKPAILRRSVVASSTATPYVRFGDYLPWMSLAVALAALVRRRLLSRKEASAGPRRYGPEANEDGGRVAEAMLGR